MIEWQHFSFSLELYLSCTHLSAYLSNQDSQRCQEKENDPIKNEQIISFLDCMCKTRCMSNCSCRAQELWVGIKKLEVGIDFSSSVGVAGSSLCALSEQERMERIEDKRNAVYYSITQACNTNIMQISSAKD